MFGGVWWLFRDGHSQLVQDQVLDVLEACTEELEVVTQPILDAILLCLLPTNKEENPTSFDLAQRFVRRCFAKLQTPISNFINEVSQFPLIGVKAVIIIPILMLITRNMNASLFRS